ncbi:TIGR01906 family membrane protein [Pseudarthrobacter sulfonivorans]|uniref:TIGR01906 family membrane protein n=1 Tax=Pseudarthrobacter sulfonivorans TaxID=121292 RepID=UPI0028588A50|nr:TIGR01906 family membrane protein [Pseudarthrobacter sulfonivorans]MDR6415362.1 integral membrane protein (TIGR01906 family) [Pseudarthrobacter sulfonivorans]
MNDNSPTPAKRSEPQPDPVLDTSSDSDEPAFAWMTGQPESRADRKAAEAAVEPSSVEPSVTEPSAAEPSVTGPSAAEPSATERSAAGPSAAGRPGAQRAAVAPTVTGKQERPLAGAARHQSAPFSEPLPTSALQVRPPKEDVERRNAERESAANAKPVAPRIWQVLLALFYPVILLVLAVRAVTSPLFLWVEYNRPGFPGDGYGFSTDDRMTYGSYTVDYLSNWAGPRYLGDLVNRSGDSLFKDGEVSHMADVKLVILSAFGAGALLIVLSIVAIAYLRRRSTGGVRRGLFAGSIVSLAIILGLGVLAVLGWQQFFTEFHRIFFASGSWTFALEDTLIRLFPGQFWIDAGIVIAGLVFLASVVTLILTWPTRRRRGLVKDDQKATDVTA